MREVRDDPDRARQAMGGERFIAFMATHGLRDLYFFCKAILGFRDLVPHLHADLCRFAERETPRRRGFLLPRGHLKTLASGTIVHAPSGPRRIDDLQIGDVLCSLSDEYQSSEVRVLARQDYETDLFRVRLASGIQFDATSTHPLRTVLGWRTVAELSPGDGVATARRLPVPRAPGIRPYSAGALCGDGCGANSSFTCFDPEILDRMRWEGLELRARKKSHCYGVPASQYPSGLRCGAWDKSIPGQYEGSGAFLGGLYDTDGTVNLVSGGTVLLNTVSEKLARDVQRNLRYFGIVARIGWHRTQGPHGYRGTSWYISITGSDQATLFQKHIGFEVARKAERLAAIVNRREPHRSSRLTCVPPQWRELMKPGKRGRMGDPGDFQRSRFSRYRIDNHYWTTQAKVAKIAELLGRQDIAALAAEGVCWDEIRSIEPMGRGAVVGIEVSGNSAYLAELTLHHNSSCITVGKNTWRLMQDPLQRRAIFHEKSTQAIQFLENIKHHLTANELLKSLYPDRIPPYKAKGWRWTQEAINLPRSREFAEPSLYAAGQTAALQGFHFTAMTWDDLIGEEAAGNAENMQKVIDWMIRAEALSVTPDSLELDLIGTRWAYWDIYEWAKQSYSEMQWFERSAITRSERGEEVPLWPERFSMALLLELQRRDFVSFSNQYMNQPTTGERNEFEPEHLRYYSRAIQSIGDVEQAVCVQEDERETDGSSMVPLAHLTVYIHADPGLGITEGPKKAVSRHSRSAITVVGTGWPRRVFVLEVWAKRVGPEEFIEQILRYFRAYERQCRLVSLEKHSWTRILKAPLLARARDLGIDLTEGRIADYTKSGNQSKDGRIRSLKPYFANGQVFLSRTHTDLEREYRDFPLGKTKDILDALCQGPSGDYWRFPEDEQESPWDDWSRKGDDDPSRVSLGASPLTGY